MRPFQTIFIESDYETPGEARAARDAEAARLVAQGINCHCLTLYRATDGCRIFAIEVPEPEVKEQKHKPAKSKPVSARSRSQQHRIEGVEYR